ncbi:MAG TPA: oligopeptide/dipeptide ABC transporter ATP-binding protein, partial [bacterium]
YTQGLLRCIPGVGATQRGQHLGSIPGMVPNLVGEQRGCAFRERCPHAFADCAATEVPLHALTHGRGYRCLLSEEQATRNATTARSGAVA